MPPPPATSSSQASPPAEGGQKPLSGLSLYAGISFSGNRAASSSSTDATSTSAPAPSTTTEASGSSPSATTKPVAPSSWSAALRFAPRKSSSSSNSASAANRNRPRAAIVAPSFSSSTPNPLQVDEDVSQDETKSSETAAVAAAGMPGRSRSNPSPARSGSGWATVASGSAAPTQPSSAVPATAIAPTSASTPPPPTVLALPSNLASSSKYILPVVTAPPELRLPQAELDADKAMARDAAIARGERAQPQQQQQQREWGGDEHGGYDEGGTGGGWDEDEDVNGFAMSSAGQKARKKRSKRRRQHSPGRPPPINWDADYDPRTPNDYAAWKDVVRNRREALKRMEAQRRREAGDGDDDQEDERDWVDERDRDREVDEERLRKYRKWAPPPSYATSAGAKQRTAFNGEEEEEEEKLYISPPPPERPAAPQTAPYVQYGQPPPAFVQPARPAPPSFVTASASTAEAGSSIGSPYTSQLPPPSRQSETSSTPQRPMTGEEAYQRRLAMSQQAAHASPPVIARASPVDASLSRSPLPPAFQGGGEGEGGDVKSSPAPAMDLAARQSAAAAIAARLASIAPPAQPARPGPPPPPPPPPSFVPGGAGSSSALNNDVAPEGEEEEGDFATRLMSKWGHQSGQGLGAEGNQGMTEALVMNKVSNSKTGGWRKGPDFSGGDGFGPSGPSSSGNGASSMGPRGRYATADPRARADLEKYGQPSEVILLHGLLSPPAKARGHSPNPNKGEGEGGDVDEALPGEIAEECAKYGYVERVAIYPHISPPLPSGSASFSPSTALDREASGTGGVVFVVFTGLVGAYKAVRELNGRFFSGRKVRARYFPKQAFAKGEDAWREEVRGWLAGGGAGA